MAGGSIRPKSAKTASDVSFGSPTISFKSTPRTFDSTVSNFKPLPESSDFSKSTLGLPGLFVRIAHSTLQPGGLKLRFSKIHASNGRFQASVRPVHITKRASVVTWLSGARNP
jgi:hypothetical protein